MCEKFLTLTVFFISLKTFDSNGRREGVKIKKKQHFLLIVIVILFLSIFVFGIEKDNPEVISNDNSITYIEEGNITGISLYLDQDALLSFYSNLNEDRNYTMGLAMKFSGGWVKKSHVIAPLNFFDKIFGINSLRSLMKKNSSEIAIRHSFMFGNSAFTPDKLDTESPIHDDCPYSSLLYFVVGKNFFNTDKHYLLKTELSIGFLGLRFSESVQIHLHRWIRKFNNKDTPYDPLGWKNQISDGGEPTMMYSVSFRKLTFHKKWFDSVFSIDGTLGYYTNFGYGLFLRAGNNLKNIPWWIFKERGLSQGDRIYFSRKKNTNFGFFVYADFHHVIVGYNALLQGQFRHSEVRLKSNQIEKFLYEFELGIHFLLSKYLNFTWVVLAGRSPEMKVGSPRHHMWGGCYLTFNIYK